MWDGGLWCCIGWGWLEEVRVGVGRRFFGVVLAGEGFRWRVLAGDGCSRHALVWDGGLWR